MPWVKIDDHFDEHPKLARVGPLGWGIWLAGIAYSNRNLTDGFIPREKALTLASFTVTESDGKQWELGRTCGHQGEDIHADWIIGMLVDAGLWRERSNGNGRIDGYDIHDYDLYQPSRKEVLAERARTAKVRAAAGRQGGIKSGVSRRTKSGSKRGSKTEANGEAKRKQSGSPVPDPLSGEERTLSVPKVQIAESAVPADSMAPSAPPVALAPRSIAITPRPVSAEENQRAAAAIDGIERELLGAVDAFKPGQWWGRGRKLGRRPAALVSTLERVWMKLRLGVPPDDLFAYAEGAYLEIQRDQAIDHAEQEQEGRKHEPTIYDQG